ncbi:tetratricopeptide repeat-containing sulfotransferase family protein [Microbulbifer hydrolyticus]|uniref:Tetratricopeptide (TPR) repeat protein n=1 Tax=Microbulbifer hydrolyticus TaxID=48074 RepID=A0A6P1T8D4_9GAMM|nr:sulfotransferase [Microbulbifer hydrolyticus]MBB5211722.1 tetratricopeptide (TPR) repeat protein [Microbulbifer hydrolyticus]QHQ37549.1 tetratricopeptide repeat protein [Microbulbifer hydrolyticus]
MSEHSIRQLLDFARRSVAEGDWRSVTSRCITVLKSDPQQAEAHTLLGLAALEGGKPEIAVRAFKTALREDASFAEARVYLARILAANGQFAAAESEAAQCVEKISGNPVLLDTLATLYSRIGRQQKALLLYQQAHKLAPKNVGILANMAAVQIFLGDSAEAATALKRGLQLAPDHYRSHWLLAKCHRSEERAAIQAQLNALLSLTQAGTPQALPYLHYAAGKLCEDLADWSAAWEHYQSGATAQRQRLHYSNEQEQEVFAAVREYLGAQWYRESGKNAGTESKNEEVPIFIVGLPRSGSTLVEQILGCHSQVQALGELLQWPLAVKHHSGNRDVALHSPDSIRASAKKPPVALGQLYQKNIAHLRNDRRFFTDKLPGNFLYLSLIARALPRARFVHVTRDPMDAGFAIYKQLFADAYPWSYDLEELGSYYVEYQKLMQDWQDLLGDRIYTVNYETLVADPQGATRALLDWLELPFESACLKFYQTQTVAATASASQVREPIHQRSSGRWQKFAAQLQPYRTVLESAGILPPG